MAKRRKPRMLRAEWAAWRAQRLSELPPGIPVDYFGELCQRIDACTPWGCEGDKHSLSAALDWIQNTDYADREPEILAWVEGLSGVCDCSIRDRAYRRIQRVFDGYEDDSE